MNKKSIAIVGIVVVALSVYFITFNSDKGTPLESETQNIKQLVDDYSAANNIEESASITSHQLIVTKANDEQLAYQLPDDEFFVSIAPYVETTHPCAIHNLIGCQGEMVEEEFQVYIEDMEGNVVMDQTMKSLDNGFIDLWLPREKTYNVTIGNNGKSVTTEISTFEGDNTCITTMQLI